MSSTQFGDLMGEIESAERLRLRFIHLLGHGVFGVVHRVVDYRSQRRPKVRGRMPRLFDRREGRLISDVTSHMGSTPSSATYGLLAFSSLARPPETCCGIANFEVNQYMRLGAKYFTHCGHLSEETAALLARILESNPILLIPPRSPDLSRASPYAKLAAKARR
ncbi:hypothetical protein OF83DRAFT_1282922 [Amylostereum chailletii]|nr:hypothetical protein OF83DRAFT_1282922 [Amylostereum chailletii]